MSSPEKLFRNETHSVLQTRQDSDCLSGNMYKSYISYKDGMSIQIYTPIKRSFIFLLILFPCLSIEYLVDIPIAGFRISGVQPAVEKLGAGI